MSVDHQPSPKRILMTADTIGGVWTYVLELAQALDQLQIEVIIASMGKRMSTSQRESIRALRNVKVIESCYRLEWMNDPWDDVQQAGDWLLQIADDVQPDVVHLNSYAHGSLSWNRPTLIVGHSCVLSWWQAVRGRPAPASWNRYRSEITKGLRNADVVIAPTRAMLAELRRFYGPFAAERVIPNGRTIPASVPLEKEPFILSAGRLWDEAKNISILERIAASLEWPVLVAGESAHPDGGDACLNSITLLGHLSPRTLADYYASAAIYALPARYEPFGLSVLEAAQAGCALVLGDIPSLREVWGNAAVFVQPEDEDSLKAAIQSLIADPTRRQQLAARAQRQARKYSPPRMAQAYLHAYAEIMDSTLQHNESALPDLARTNHL